MIIDTVYHDDKPPTIYTRYRDGDGKLVSDIIEDYKPYLYIPINTAEYTINNVMRSFPLAKVNRSVRYEGLDKTLLFKVESDSPFDIMQMSKMFPKTYEGDVRFEDQYMIDTFQEMPKWKPRKWWYDIECDTGDDKFTTVIAVIDSDLDRPEVFAWADERTNSTEYHAGTEYSFIQRKVRDEKYILHLYSCEKDMYDGFIEFLQERDPDMMIAHAGTFFDIPHMIERIDKIYGFGSASKLSPLGIIRYPKKGERYRYDAQPIAGRIQFDTSAPESTGTGFERVWKDSGGGQLPNLKLNTIAETLGLGSKLTEEIEGMTVHNGWYEYFDDFVDYCLLDTVLLRGIDESRNVTDFYMEMVRLTGVSFKSVSNVTNFARGLISRRTGLKAPSRYQSSHDKLKGAEFIKKDNGLYENVALLDYKGLYPSLMSGFNLCWTTKRDRPGEDVISLENGTHWYQGEKGILPQIVDYLFEYRDECKQKMRNAETKEERAAWNTTQSAVKRVMASLYGMTAHSGYGWSDLDIAETILSQGRRCIALLDTVATNMGYNVIYGFTDSAFIQVPLEDAEKLAARITTVVQEETGNSKLIAELEAYMDYWYLETSNRYAGIVSYPPEDEGKWKNAQLMKGSGKAPISKRAERTVLELVCTGASEGDVRNAVLEMVLPIRKGEYNMKEITQSTRIGVLSKRTAAGQAALYYNNHNDDKYVVGDSVQYVYVSHPPQGMPPTKYAAYRETDELDGYELDENAIIEKLIQKKIGTVFNVLGWDIEAAMGKPKPATYW